MISEEYKFKEKNAMTTIKTMIMLFLLFCAIGMVLVFINADKYAVYTAYAIAALTIFVSVDTQFDLIKALLKELDAEIEWKQKNVK